MTGAHETELERAVRIWEATGALPEGRDDRSRELRRVLLALDLERSRPTDAQIELVLSQISSAAAPSRSGVEQARELWTRVQASLRLDLMQANPAFRSGASLTPTIFETPRFAITIAVGVDTMRGSVHPRGTSALPVGGRAVLQLGGEARAADLDARGGFLFEELELGEAELEIEIDGERILLGSFPDPSH